MLSSKLTPCLCIANWKVEVFDDDGTANVTVRTRNLELANRLSNDKEGFSDGINFVLSNLPRDKTVLFEVADSRGAARRFYISRWESQVLNPQYKEWDCE